MTTQKNKPALTIRDRNLKVTIWKNSGEKGDFYTVQFTRSYRDDQGNYHDSDSYSGSELLRVSRLHKRTNCRIV